jgi:sn-glycerol 3-phosphate transport system substrate-binding protein
VAIQQLNKPPGQLHGHRFAFMPQIREIIDEEWESILADKKSPQQGLDDMVRRGNEKLREFERINK